MTHLTHPCKACGRTTVSTFDYCAFCQNGYVPPRLLGIMRWKGGVLIPVDPPPSATTDG